MSATSVGGASAAGKGSNESPGQQLSNGATPISVPPTQPELEPPKDLATYTTLPTVFRKYLHSKLLLLLGLRILSSKVFQICSRGRRGGGSGICPKFCPTLEARSASTAGASGDLRADSESPRSGLSFEYWHAPVALRA